MELPLSPAIMYVTLSVPARVLGYRKQMTLACFDGFWVFLRKQDTTYQYFIANSLDALECTGDPFRVYSHLATSAPRIVSGSTATPGHLVRMNKQLIAWNVFICMVFHVEDHSRVAVQVQILSNPTSMNTCQCTNNCSCFQHHPHGSLCLPYTSNENAVLCCGIQMDHCLL